MGAVLLRVHLIPSPVCAEGANIEEEQGVREQCLLCTGEGGDSWEQPVCDAGTSPSGHGASAGSALTALAAACSLLSWHRGRVWARISSAISFCSSSDGRAVRTVWRCTCAGAGVPPHHRMKILQWSDPEFCIATGLNCKKTGICRLDV